MLKLFSAVKHTLGAFRHSFYKRMRRQTDVVDRQEAGGSAIEMAHADLAEAAFNRGQVTQDEGDLDRALADYDRAIRLRPDHADAYRNRGLTYAKMGDLDRAGADFKKLLELSQDPELRKAAEEELAALGA